MDDLISDFLNPLVVDVEDFVDSERFLIEDQFSAMFSTMEDLFGKKRDRHYPSNFLAIVSSLCLSSLPEGAAGICSIMITCEGLL